MLQLLLFVLPLGLDTLGVSVSLGMKVVDTDSLERVGLFPLWIRSALLFALAEMIMPLIGLTIGYTASLLVSEVMHFVGPSLLLGIGLWEMSGEVREVVERRKEERRAYYTLQCSFGRGCFFSFHYAMGQAATFSTRY